MINKKIKLGIYGGTFNPPHIAHVRAAELFYEAVKPDKLLIIPDFLPPHKQFSGTVTPQERLEMCEIAFSHIPNVTVSDTEIKRGGKSYTAVTLEELSAENTELYFLVGTDMILTMDSWYMPEKIFELATICYIRRESDRDITEKLAERSEYYKTKYGARIIFIDAEPLAVSSTDIREALLKGCKSELLSPKINDYIAEKGLYR